MIGCTERRATTRLVATITEATRTTTTHRPVTSSVTAGTLLQSWR